MLATTLKIIGVSMMIAVGSLYGFSILPEDFVGDSDLARFAVPFWTFAVGIIVAVSGAVLGLEDEGRHVETAIADLDPNRTSNDALLQQIAALEAENHRLRQLLLQAGGQMQSVA